MALPVDERFPSASGTPQRPDPDTGELGCVVPTSSQDEALARYSVSREVPCSVLKWETVLGSLDATPKVP